MSSPGNPTIYRILEGNSYLNKQAGPEVVYIRLYVCDDISLKIIIYRQVYEII